MRSTNSGAHLCTSESRDSPMRNCASEVRPSDARNDDQHVAFAMTPGEIDKIFRDEAGRALATLIRLVGDFDLAEDALQDAFAVALARWPACEVPDNPRAWLVNVAKHKAIDRIRRQAVFRGKEQAHEHELELNAQAPNEPPAML